MIGINATQIGFQPAKYVARHETDILFKHGNKLLDAVIVAGQFGFILRDMKCFALDFAFPIAIKTKTNLLHKRSDNLIKKMMALDIKVGSTRRNTSFSPTVLYFLIRLVGIGIFLLQLYYLATHLLA